MCNSGQRRRSPDFMLHQTLSKGWCRHGSGLLLGFIVRARGRLVEARTRFAAAAKSGRPALISDPEVLTLAILAQWPRFRSERDFWRFAWAHLRSYFPKPLFAEPVQSAHRALEPEMRALQRASRGARLSFGRLSRDGHDTRAVDREGEIFSQGTLLPGRLPSGGAPPRRSGSTASRRLWWWTRTA